VLTHVVLLLAETNALLFASEGLSNRMVFTLATWLVLDIVVLSESHIPPMWPCDPLGKDEEGWCTSIG
jgi:hypothetical protein